jgi:hypothetical protein
MAFAATLTLTIAGTPYVLNRVNSGNYGSEYSLTSATEQVTLKIRHSQDSPDSDGIEMKRHNVYIERIVYPTPTTLLKKQTLTFTMRGGEFEDPVPMADVARAALVWLSASTYAAVVDLSVGVN